MTAAGIDVGKASLDLAVDGRAGVTRFANDRSGIAKLVRRLQTLGAERTVVEATGGYEEPLPEACCGAGLWIARVNPRQARDFARATGELAKTDAIDARLLALMARLFGDRLRRHVAPPPWQRELRGWLRRRRQVVVLIQAQKQQAAMAPPAVHKLVARTIAALSRERAAIEAAMKGNDPGARFPGTALGQGLGQRRICGGRAAVRVALYMATLSAVRWDPLMKAHYRQLRARGKLGKVVLVACMRKLLGIVNARRRDELRVEGLVAA